MIHDFGGKEVRRNPYFFMLKIMCIYIATDCSAYFAKTVHPGTWKLEYSKSLIYRNSEKNSA